MMIIKTIIVDIATNETDEEALRFLLITYDNISPTEVVPIVVTGNYSAKDNPGALAQLQLQQKQPSHYDYRGGSTSDNS